ncbi:MAG TPA: hypothetical protein VGR26_04565 [Acidimicrobiales bacterium]|nr:hypothetical protein [Acidimicrobiales bacterium]
MDEQGSGRVLDRSLRAGEQGRSVPRHDGLHEELVSSINPRSANATGRASHRQTGARLPLELLDGLPEVTLHERRVPIDPIQGARHDVLLCRSIVRAKGIIQSAIQSGRVPVAGGRQAASIIS